MSQKTKSAELFLFGASFLPSSGFSSLSSLLSQAELVLVLLAVFLEISSADGRSPKSESLFNPWTCGEDPAASWHKGSLRTSFCEVLPPDRGGFSLQQQHCLIQNPTLKPPTVRTIERAYNDFLCFVLLPSLLSQRNAF